MRKHLAVGLQLRTPMPEWPVSGPDRARAEVRLESAMKSQNVAARPGSITVRWRGGTQIME